MTSTITCSCVSRSCGISTYYSPNPQSTFCNSAYSKNLNIITIRISSYPYAESRTDQPQISPQYAVNQVSSQRSPASQGKRCIPGPSYSQSFWNQIATLIRDHCADPLSFVGISAIRSPRTCRSILRRRAKKRTRVRPSLSHPHHYWTFVDMLIFPSPHYTPASTDFSF